MIEPVIYLCDLKNVHVITIKEIVLIKAQRSYYSIFLQDGEAITYTKSLSCIGKVLKGNKFLRIGQSHIINRNQIRKIDKVNKLIKLTGDHQIRYPMKTSELLGLLGFTNSEDETGDRENG